jgi:hypothetical protein
MNIDENNFLKVISVYAQKHVSAILQVSEEQNISPFLITALGERESGWGKFLDSNLCGDNGHGHGYLQIDDRSFGNWLKNNNWKDAYTNATFGIRLFKSNIAFLSNNQQVPGLTDGKIVTVHLHAAQARGCMPGTYKDPRPLQADNLIFDSVAAYNTGIGNVLMSVAVGVNVDITTANLNYAKDVIANYNTLLSNYNNLD